MTDEPLHRAQADADEARAREAYRKSRKALDRAQAPLHAAAVALAEAEAVTHAGSSRPYLNRCNVAEIRLRVAAKAYAIARKEAGL